MAIFLSNMALRMLDASCHLFFSLRPLVTSLVSFSNMALPTTDLNSVDCHFPIQHGTPHVGCFLSFVFYFADPLLLPPSTHPPFHSFHTRHAPPRHRLLLFVVAAGFRSLFSGSARRSIAWFSKCKTPSNLTVATRFFQHFLSF